MISPIRGLPFHSLSLFITSRPSMFTFGLFEHLIYLFKALEPYLSPDANPMMEGMLYEIIRFLALDPIDVVVGIIYLQRLLFAMPRTPTALSCYNKPLVFLASLNIAHKFVSDFSYTRAHQFSSILRSLNCLQHHLNSCERSFVGIIDWDLTVSEIQINTLNATFKDAPDPRSRIWYLTQTNYAPPPLARADARAGEEFNRDLTTSNLRPQTSDGYEQGRS